MRDRKCADSDCGNGATQPRLAMQSGIDTPADPADSDSGRENLRAEAFNENERINSRLFAAAIFSLFFCLLEYPIHAVGPDCVQAFDVADWEQRGVGVIILDNELVAVLLPNARGCLSAHASGPFACRYQAP